MGASTVSLVLVVVLGLTATLPGPTVGQAQGGSPPGPTEDPLWGRLDTRFTELRAKLKEVNTQLDRIDNHLKGISMPQVYSGCEDALARGLRTSGVYTIALTGFLSTNVYCEQRLDGGGWTVFQTRFNGFVDFNQDWNTYKTGFGYLTEEFWLGNEALHQLTKQHTYQLKVELTDVDGEVQYADYNQFSVGDENDKYRLNVTGYTGGNIPGDSMRYPDGSQFSTKDQNNDAIPGRCADQHVGGWWYNGCNWPKLNDQYGNENGAGWMCWWSWKPVKRLIKTRLMIRKTQ